MRSGGKRFIIKVCEFLELCRVGTSEFGNLVSLFRVRTEMV